VEGFRRQPFGTDGENSGEKEQGTECASYYRVLSHIGLGVGKTTGKILIPDKEWAPKSEVTT